MQLVLKERSHRRFVLKVLSVWLEQPQLSLVPLATGCLKKDVKLALHAPQAHTVEVQDSINQQLSVMRDTSAWQQALLQLRLFHPRVAFAQTATTARKVQSE
jgi:hypothetical protein